ncbi:MAG: rhomboid family intramembrane serine protease [Proteobacteria bacterium]|nr:rhomboid family intramembrane serine protease [Pseudomonadota bacterium]
MIPLKDTIPSKTKPVINYLIIIITCIIFFLQLSAGVRHNFLIDSYAFIPKELYLFLNNDLLSISPFKRMFTSMFLHGGFFHLLGNMLYLYIFGDNVEDTLGHFNYLIFYILSGIIAAFFHYLFNPASSVPTLGASGAVAGVMGAYFVLFPKSRVITLVPIFIFFQIIEIPAFFFLLFWFLMQLMYGSASLFSGIQNIAWWAHIGGFVFGIVVSILFSLTKYLRRY